MTRPIATDQERRRWRLCNTVMQACRTGGRPLPASLRVDTSAVDRLLAEVTRG